MSDEKPGIVIRCPDDGKWHAVECYYDGERVKLWLDRVRRDDLLSTDVAPFYPQTHSEPTKERP